MNYRNDDIPEVIYEAIKRRDEYYTGDRSKFDYSITDLQQSPKMYWLKQRHDNEITVDASTQFWALFGSSVHALLEKVQIKGSEAEKRRYTTIEGKTISGGIDRYIIKKQEATPEYIMGLAKHFKLSSTTHTIEVPAKPPPIHIIQDYKVTSVWDAIYQSSYNRYEKQLNGYGYLYRINGYPVDELEIIAIYRDWHQSKVGSTNGYPEKPIQAINFPLYSMEQAMEYLVNRINNISKYEYVPDDGIPECSEIERWQDPDKWAIYKGKRRDRASKVCETEEEAIQWRKKFKDKIYEIKFRPSKPKRCIDYCIVNKFCHWYKQWNNK